MSITNTCLVRQRGLTLIELMISIAIGLFILGGLAYLMSSTFRTNTDTLRSTRLNQELRSALQVISRDLRRAGGSGKSESAIQFSSVHGLSLGAISGNGITINATPAGTRFDTWIQTAVSASLDVYIRAVTVNIINGTKTNSCLKITAWNSNTQLTGNNVACPGEGSANAMPATNLSSSSWIFDNTSNNVDFLSTGTNPTCLMFRYDVDKSNAIAATETIGYRYDATTKAIEAWQSDATSPSNCASNTAVWANLTDDSSIGITNFTVTRLTPAGSALSEFKIEITGQLLSDTSVTRRVEEVVRIRNDNVLDL